MGRHFTQKVKCHDFAFCAFSCFPSALLENSHRKKKKEKEMHPLKKPQQFQDSKDQPRPNRP